MRTAPARVIRDCVLAFCLLVTAVAASAETPVPTTLPGCDCAYSIQIENSVAGRQPVKETISAKNRRDGALYMHWTSGVAKDRELVYRPGWNDGEAWIKEGGALSFTAVSLPLDDPILTSEYHIPPHLLTPVPLEQMVDAWKAAGTVREADDGSTVVERPGEGTLTHRLTEDGGRAVVIRDEAGEPVASYRLSAIVPAPALPDDAFDPANPEYGFPGYSEDGIFIDHVKLKRTLTNRWTAVKDYEGLLIKQERIRGKLEDKQTILVRSKKPASLYMKWIEEPHKGREVIYRPRIDERIVVHEGGVLGFLTVRLKLDSPLVTRSSNHTVDHLDLSYSIEQIVASLVAGMENDDVKLEFKGIRRDAGRALYIVDSRFGTKGGYYAPRSVVGHDRETGLPLYFANYDENDELWEEFDRIDTKFNVGLTDADFDPKNPGYDF